MIPVAKGTTLTEGVVADTCEVVGMKAVCPGDSSCKYYGARCQEVDFQNAASRCGNAMLGLAKALWRSYTPKRLPSNGWSV